MNEINTMATALGKAIASSEPAVKLREARKLMETEPDLVKTLQSFQEQAAHLTEMEQQNTPIEVSDKHKLQELHDKLVASETFKKFTAAQVEYVDMMRQVNEAIRQQVSQE